MYQEHVFSQALFAGDSVRDDSMPVHDLSEELEAVNAQNAFLFTDCHALLAQSRA